MKRTIAVMIQVCALLAGNANAAEELQSRLASAEAAAGFLMETAAADFRQSQPPYPDGFRSVRIGNIIAPNGSSRDILCGEYRAFTEAGGSDWVPFLTIRTDPYEQWLGNQASSFCELPEIVWLKQDYSSRMQEFFDASR